MTLIDRALLLKRAEHNDGDLQQLEEITLHQFEITKIEHLDLYVRNLKILFLQNNLIAKIENLHRMKRLEYINFALNNITTIENLHRCEALRKLDFTINFIAELTSVKNLVPLQELRELYLTGNPCTQYEGYRAYVIAILPQLQRLDGEEISVSERDDATATLEQLTASIETQQAVKLAEEAERATNPNSSQAYFAQAKETALQEEASRAGPRTPASRTLLAQTFGKQEIQQDENKPQNQTADHSSSDRDGTDAAAKGRIYQKNDLKLPFEWEEEETDRLLLHISLPVHIDTANIDVSIQPTWVRVEIHQKILQLHVPAEVDEEHCSAERNIWTGRLTLCMTRRGHGPPPTAPPPKRGDYVAGKGRTGGLLVTNVTATPSSRSSKPRRRDLLLEQQQQQRAEIKTQPGPARGVPSTSIEEDDDGDVPPLEAC